LFGESAAQPLLRGKNATLKVQDSTEAGELEAADRRPSAAHERNHGLPVDETLVAVVMATGATQAELAEAFAWSNNDEALINEGRPLPTGRVAALVALLNSDEEEP